MQKQVFDKKIIIGICAAVAVAVAVLVLIFHFNKEEAYRSILVYNVEGSAVIEREGVGSMDAVENLYLESGDRVSVAADSGMRMKLDDDKYVMAEADTIFSVEAQGTDADSKTRICLEQGAITNEIQHPLSAGSQYETSTPNSVMAVRGTIYRVELYTDENGDKNTKLCCFQGKVGTKPILPDGTYGEEVLVPAGSELVIYKDGSVEGPAEITYEALPAQALLNLKSMAQSGQSMTGITLEDLTALAEQAANRSEAAEENEPEQAQTADVGGESVQSDPDSAKEDAQTDEAAAKTENTSKSASERTNKGTGATESLTQEAAKPETAAENTQAKTQQSTPIAASAQTGSDNGGGSSGDNGSSSSGGNNHAGGNGQTPDYNMPDENPPEIKIPDGNHQGGYVPVVPPQIPTYTVTFTYQGKTFATQSVKSGKTVSEPLLMPTQSGAWEFDFTTAITADTTVTWKENQ